MFDYSGCKIQKVSVHQVGNKSAGEDLILSKDQLFFSGLKLQELLMKFFLSNFKSQEFYSFTFSNGEVGLNPVFNIISEIFEDNNSFHKRSVDLARQLFESSNHPNIKSGDFYIALLSDLQIENVITDAIGLFKSETRDEFLKLDSSPGEFSLDHDSGINPEKLDKGCLIFNTQAENGYKIWILDRANRTEAQFWKDTFLNVKPASDNFHHTQNFLTYAKTFVTQRLPEEFEVSKTDKADYLNRSMEYFKKNEQFDEQEFANQVFEDKEVIKSFNKYREDFQEEMKVELPEDFSISSTAVKKQARVFKSVLKLDKNFHIYIHGDKNLIEKGIENDGRKFYKIYYKEED